MAGRTAILRGEVTSARERDLAELAALVEPGISAVKNELVVATPAPNVVVGSDANPGRYPGPEETTDHLSSSR